MMNMDHDDGVDHISPCIGSYYETMILIGDEDDEEDYSGSGAPPPPPPPPSSFSSSSSFSLSEKDEDRRSSALTLQQRRAGVATGDRTSDKNLIPKFNSETLQYKLSKIYGHDFGSLPFDLAGTENDNAYLVLPEKRKLVERNYQLLLAIHQFQTSLVQIYGPVGGRVMTEERRAVMLQ
jgi:hypothetical protein